ncbi:methionine--tRNA ligase, mitochondrial-like isoform X2 [Ptychodera flava]|uniref:methionine--tRNA ligase, mitochondrial-like isoform X2 n=1 Tax=Ptychodera flava TaxID=63121 RepID=UPI003969BC23
MLATGRYRLHRLFSSVSCFPWSDLQLWCRTSLRGQVDKIVHPERNKCRSLSSRNLAYRRQRPDIGGSPFITTPIFYVNAVPHIGHLYSATLADTLHRWHRLLGYEDTIFATGTDEHGLKVQQAAARHDKPTKLYCDEVSHKFKELFNECDIQYTDFIRTTEERHYEAVNYFWNKLMSNGYIYEGTYEGWYAVSDEAFLTDSQVKDIRDERGNVIKVSMETGNPVEWTQEKNYMFRLSDFGARLQKWLEDNPNAIKPAKFIGIVQQWIQEGLPDLSVSRQRDRLEWGIPVPGDETQTIYVWLDALVNYLTVCGYPHNTRLWPGVNLVGKDILKFHAVYWPAFLMAADLPPPRSVLCHSHWTVNGQKMSKSKGNVVDPFEKVKTYTKDGLRYFLMREGVPHSDGDYSDEKVVRYLNAELVDTFGNLLSRCTGKALNPQQIFPAFDETSFPPVWNDGCRVRKEDYELIQSMQQLPDRDTRCIEDACTNCRDGT